MKYWLSRAEPPGTRVLLVESGARSLLEDLVPLLLDTWAADYQFDLLTCYGGMPQALPTDTDVFRVYDYATSESRKALLRELRFRDYAYVGLLCSGEPILSKWKWLVALSVPAKVFIVNENGDYFWLHRDNAAIVREFALVRAGLEGANAGRTLARLAIFPFAVLYLLLYAAQAHLRRGLRLLL